MAQERIELRFSPGDADERALIDALEAQGGEYGVKGRFLKARLVRGFDAVLKELDGIERESDPLAALDRLARSVNSGHYRVLRALLSQRQRLGARPAAGPHPDWRAFRALAGTGSD